MTLYKDLGSKFISFEEITITTHHLHVGQYSSVAHYYSGNDGEERVATTRNSGQINNIEKTKEHDNSINKLRHK